jgi:SAM-dependent methyltransferase
MTPLNPQDRTTDISEGSIVPPFDLASLAPYLEQREPGLWFAKQNQGTISYPAHGNATCLEIEDRSFWFRHRNRVIVEFASRFHREGVFLDVGGGNGYVARGLISAGIRCALIEPGLDGALAARARGVDPVICGRFEDIGLPPGCAASVGLFDVLEHIEGEAATLKLIHSTLEPSGHLFLTVPAYQFLHSSEDDAAGHFRRYTIPRLGRVLTKNNFRIKFSSYFFFPLPPLILFARTIPTRLGMRREGKDEIASSEHTPGGFAARMMDCMLDLELRYLRAGKRSPFGGSCFCVAVKE